MNTARGLGDQFTTQVNLESTQELRAFATVDLVKINKDRSNQLKMALEDNLREKEKEMNEVQGNYKQQKEEYDKISRKYQEKNGELEQEINKQKNYISNMKEQLRSIENEYKIQLQEYNEFEDQIRQAIDISQESIDKHQKLIQDNENELSVLNSQKKGLQMGIEMQRKVRIQELDMKIIPLKEEKDKISMHLEMINENLRMLNEVKFQNENEKMMIEEDLYVSENNKVEQVFQREELEGYLEKLKSENDDIRFITSQYYQLDITSQQDWQQVVKLLVDDKQRNLLLDLIRELQQYILGMSSGTTDNSVMQSDELEELEYLINKKKVDHSQAVEIIVEFAQRKLRLNIGSDSLLDKLNQVSDSIDIESIKSSLIAIQEIEQQMKIIDNKIKIMYNRCQNELKPRFKALTQSEETFSQEITQGESTVNELNEYVIELEKEISNIQNTFEETYKPKNEEYQEIEDKLKQIQSQIQDIEYNIDNYKQQQEQDEITKQDAINRKQQKDIEFDSYKQHYSQISTQLKEQLKRDRQLQSEGYSNPAIEELQLLVAQIKCDKESASKRLSYVENKFKNAQDSVQHAKQVLENHILQSQQEQLNQKVQHNNIGQFNQKRNSALPNQGTQITYGPTLTSRISNIQQKGQTLQRGQVLSPSKEESRIENSRNMSIRKEQMTPAQMNNDQETMHSHFIDQNQSQIMTEMKRNHYSNTHLRNVSNIQNQSTQLAHSGSANELLKHRIPQNNQSSNDMVRYYEVSSVQSSQDSHINSNFDQYMNKQSNQNQRSIPIQSLITPRDPLQELQNLKQINNNNFIYETHQQMSSVSNDSINNSTMQFERKHSICNETISNFYDTQQSNYQQNVYQQQKLPLRQHNNSSTDMKQGSNTKNVNIQLYTQFKENITPNNINQGGLNNTNSSFNMRKLSQASNISQISNQSILNTIQSISQGGSRPPAVPQSKMYLTSGSNIQQLEDTTPRQNMHKTRTASMRMTTTSKLNNTQNGNNTLLYTSGSNNSRNASKDSFITQPSKTIQTKIKLHVNGKNTRPIQVGVVDLSKCQQSSKDSQFFESVKPLIEGAQFLVAQDGQYVLKQFYMDFSLMRIFLVNFNGEKEIIMIDNIVKPEMPQSTLDQIRQEKNNSPCGQNSNNSHYNSNGKRYEFNLIVNFGGQLQRLQILAMSYDELRQWIVGINALLQNKSQLMRLSSNIQTITN